MAQNNKTLYEVLGVSRNAKPHEIGRAYNRIKADMQREDAAPDPRLAALAKVAYDTLCDPDSRADYDDSIGGSAPSRSGKVTLLWVALLLLITAAGGGYYFFQQRAARTAEKALEPQELLDAVSQHLGRVQGALISGEVRELGTAVAVGENEMATTCKGFAAGATLSVKSGDFSSKAELTRANEDLDVCMLAVKGAGKGLKIREGLPRPGEKIRAVVLTPTGPSQVRQGSVARTLDAPAGAVIELQMAAPLPNGTPVFDSQARLVGIVTTPHAFGEGLVVALGTSRIAQARGVAAPAVASAAPARSASSAATASAPPAAAASPSPPPLGRGSGRATLVEEGFSSLWEEDSRGQIVRAMDNLKKGQVGNPLAYWTRWSGRDGGMHDVHCAVTYGEEEKVVMDYSQGPVESPAEGYWYCAVVGDDLQDLKEGLYHFMIFVDGQKVAESSIRMEKRFFTRGTIAVIVLVVGLGLLAFLRRNKVVSYSG